MTRGVHPSRRWRSAGGRAVARDEALPAAGGGNREEEHVLEEEEERGVRGTCLEISRM
jgi:hypothetical protein